MGPAGRLGPGPMPEEVRQHLGTVVAEMLRGRVVPFLGAGVNLVRSPDGGPWRIGERLPSGSELSAYLADRYGYEGADRHDLVRVSQYVSLMSGSGPLYEELHRLFDADYPPTPVHRLLARLPAKLEAKGYPPRYQLIVTTNYDDVLERALRDEGQPFDVISYVTAGEHAGRFLHWLPEGEVRPIERPNEYLLPVREEGDERDDFLRPVILKLHGAIDRPGGDRDSYVITEDHYIDYLTRTDISSIVPVTVARKLKRSNFLFLGYGLRDWNLRVILYRIWGEQKLSYASWSIQLDPDPLDERLWRRRDVEILDIGLEEYVDRLEARLDGLPAAAEHDRE